jgi:hypothetical protein
MPREDDARITHRPGRLAALGCRFVEWEIQPRLEEREGVEAALLAAVERALAEERESVWWRSGLEDLDGGPAPQETWRDPGIVEP